MLKAQQHVTRIEKDVDKVFEHIDHFCTAPVADVLLKVRVSTRHAFASSRFERAVFCAGDLMQLLAREESELYVMTCSHFREKIACASVMIICVWMLDD